MLADDGDDGPSESPWRSRRLAERRTSAEFFQQRTALFLDGFESKMATTSSGKAGELAPPGASQVGGAVSASKAALSDYFATPKGRKSKRAATSPPVESLLALGEAPIGKKDVEALAAKVADHCNTLRDATSGIKLADKVRTITENITGINSAFHRVLSAYKELVRERATVKQALEGMKNEISGDMGSQFQELSGNLMALVSDALSSALQSRHNEAKVMGREMVAEVRQTLRDEGQSTKAVIESVVDTGVRTAVSQAIQSRHKEETTVWKQVVDEGVKSAVSEALQARPAGGQQSYAGAVQDWQQVRNRKEQTKVRVPNGPVVEIRKNIAFIIMPREEAKLNFKDSKETEKRAREAIKISEYNLRVERVFSLQDCAIKVVAKAVDIEKLKASQALKAAGLMVKEKLKSNPRISVHGVPTDITERELGELLVRDNELTDAGQLKVVYQHKVDKYKRSNTWIVELSPADRTKLLSQGRAYIGWNSCWVNDHVRIVQCFRCLDFNHISSQCEHECEICHHCAGDHARGPCPKRSEPPICYNCWEAGSADHHHSALDTKKCPLVRKKIEEKVRSTNYGD